MRALLQRVKAASVTVDGKVVGEITGGGYLVLFGAKTGDTEREVDFLAKKTAELRVFSDENGKMNLSVLDVGGSVLAVSQFTLYADCHRGRRPSFVGALEPREADRLYHRYCEKLREAGIENVRTGIFGADMLVALENDGPVTIMLDTDEIMKQ